MARLPRRTGGVLVGVSLVVLMVPTTQPEDIASFAQRVGETWKIGRRDVGDGLLMVVLFFGVAPTWLITAAQRAAETLL